MKLKFVKNYLTYKINDVAEVGDESADLIAKGYAEEIKANPVDDIVASLEARVTEIAEKVATDAAAKTVDKVGSAFKRAHIVVGNDRIENDPKNGFRYFGEFAKAVNKAAFGEMDTRLKAGAGSLNENVNADGSYVVPTDYASQIFTLILGEDQLINQTTMLKTQTAHVKLPIDNLTTIGTYPINGSWVSVDGSTASATGAGSFGQLSFDLHSYYSLVTATNELLEDNNVLLGDYLVKMAARDLDYKINRSIIQGMTNAATGIIGHAATVNVTADSGDEYVSGVGISYKDITNMVSHFLRTPFATSDSCVWLMNYSVLPQIYRLKDDSGQLIYFPRGGQANTPYPTLFGMRVVPTWHCKALGTPGDIVLADLKGYVTVTKASGVQAAESMHLYFDKNTMAYRFVFRMDGKPGLAAPYTLPDGSSFQISPFVTLSTRT